MRTHSRNWKSPTLYSVWVVYWEAFFCALFSLCPWRVQTIFSRNQNVQNPPTNRRGMDRKKYILFTPVVFTWIQLMCLGTEALNEWKVNVCAPRQLKTWHISTMTTHYCVPVLTYYRLTIEARISNFKTRLQNYAVITWATGNSRCFEVKYTITPCERKFGWKNKA